jgi:deoxyribodipyrimidine photo-lyase
MGLPDRLWRRTHLGQRPDPLVNGTIVKPAPQNRIRNLNDAAINTGGSYVLYWMTAFRRVEYNFSLQHAAHLAVEMDRPLLVFEALRAGYPYASDRLHRFILDGMADNQTALASTRVGYFPYVEPEPGAGKGLLKTLAEKACAVVTDDYPCFFIPRIIETAAQKINARLIAVDSNGLLPLSLTDRVFKTAASFRRFCQKNLPDELNHVPMGNAAKSEALQPFTKLPPGITRRWPRAPQGLLAGKSGINQIKIDHSVEPVALKGGSAAADRTLESFISILDKYAEGRNHPDKNAASNLSPYLHFGHISSHQVFERVRADQGWFPEQAASKASGARSGWWGMSESAEAFLDQLITWREIGFNMCRYRNDYNRYESLPEWAQATLEAHANDHRPHLYQIDDLAAARTHDPIWNAAQQQLRQEGRIQNYLRMLWGKKILEWSPSPQRALEIMIRLNDQYALDGRDPNSYSGIFWVLGRYDRPFGPERPIFGKIRYMSSANTRRKLRMSEYLQTYSTD